MYEELFWENEEEKILLTVTFLKETQEDTLDQICHQKKNLAISEKQTSLPTIFWAGETLNSSYRYRNP